LRKEEPMNMKRYFVIGAIVVAAAVVSILVHGALANHPPVIASLQAEPVGVPPAGTCQIVCDATDPDGDALSYNWSYNFGGLAGDGATVTWTAPNSEGSYNVTVAVTDGRGGEATGELTIDVRVNRPPTITSFVASASWTTPSGSIQVTCAASDPDKEDRDQLSYRWTTDGGDIVGTGAAVNWTAPDEVGAYNITVVVKDGYGGQDTRVKTITVATAAPPSIINLQVVPVGVGNIFLKDSSAAGCDYDVWTGYSYNITCTASGTGDLVYTWSCNPGDGVISGEGRTITWTAPNEKSVKVTVTLVVSDDTGNSAAENIVFRIPSCICNF
jgi:hypothetical protein